MGAGPGNFPCCSKGMRSNLRTLAQLVPFLRTLWRSRNAAAALWLLWLFNLRLTCLAGSHWCADLGCQTWRQSVGRSGSTGFYVLNPVGSKVGVVQNNDKRCQKEICQVVIVGTYPLVNLTYLWKITMFNPAWTGGFIRPWARWASVALARGGFSWDWPIPTLFWNGGFMSQQFKVISKDKIRYNLPYINTYLQYTYGAYGKNRSPFKSTSKQYHCPSPHHRTQAQWVMDHIARLRQGKLGHSLVICWWR